MQFLLPNRPAGRPTASVAPTQAESHVKPLPWQHESAPWPRRGVIEDDAPVVPVVPDHSPGPESTAVQSEFAVPLTPIAGGRLVASATPPHVFALGPTVESDSLTAWLYPVPKTGVIRQRLTWPIIESVVIPSKVDGSSPAVPVFAVPHHVTRGVVFAAPPKPALEPVRCVVWPSTPPAE